MHKELKAGDFYNVVLETSKLGGSLFPLIAVALSLNIILTEHRVPQALVEFMQGYISSPLMFMMLVNILLLIVGCLMTTGEAILVLAPLLAPLAESYGYNKVLFGLIMILNLEIGYLTPPVGLNLIVAMGAFKQSFGLLCQAAIPFIVHHAGLPGDRDLAALDRHVPGDGQVLGRMRAGRDLPLGATAAKNAHFALPADRGRAPRSWSGAVSTQIQLGARQDPGRATMAKYPYGELRTILCGPLEGHGDPCGQAARRPPMRACAPSPTAKPRYDQVANATGVPWYVIGIIHEMEGGLNFTTHLHNGDPLTRRTVQVPAGRPPTGMPPFQWEESAIDALDAGGLRRGQAVVDRAHRLPARGLQRLGLSLAQHRRQHAPTCGAPPTTTRRASSSATACSIRTP